MSICSETNASCDLNVGNLVTTLCLNEASISLKLPKLHRHGRLRKRKAIGRGLLWTVVIVLRRYGHYLSFSVNADICINCIRT